MNGAQPGKGGSQKPPEPMCPMCGSPMGKSPLGVAALRQVEGMATRVHKAKLASGTPRPTVQRRGY